MHTQAPAPGTDEQPYILGTDQLELDRLRTQHQVWLGRMLSFCELAKLQAGHTVLDLGCGPGYTSMDLARIVGPSGRIIARDQSRPFLSHLEQETRRLGLQNIEVSHGPAESLDLPDNTLDAVYTRWLLCWLDDPGSVVQRLARALKPGGAVLMQEYLDWASMSIIPDSVIFNRMVDACMNGWRESNITINITREIPNIARACGLSIEHFQPQERIGRVGSLEWQWMDGFYASYLPRLVQRGLFDAADHEAFKQEWQQRAADGDSFVCTPMMADVILRKPA